MNEQQLERAWTIILDEATRTIRQQTRALETNRDDPLGTLLKLRRVLHPLNQPRTHPAGLERVIGYWGTHPDTAGLATRIISRFHHRPTRTAPNPTHRP